jgi:hypothetical protein
MSEEKVVEIEPAPHQRRFAGRIAPDPQLKKAELSAIAASEILVLATAIGQVFLDGLEMRERRKERRFLALAACGLATLFGLARLAVQFIHQ